MSKRLLALLCALTCLLYACGACASPRPEGSFRIGGGGKDSPTSAPIALPNGGLVVAVLTQGGLADTPLDAKGARMTYLACLDAEGSAVWERVYAGMLLLDGLDEAGAIRAYRYYTEDGQSYAQLGAYSAETGEPLAQREPAKLCAWRVGDDPTLSSRVLPDYVLIEEIHDPEATTEPRYFRLQTADGRELWKKNQRECVIRNVSSLLQLEDGILLLGRTGEWNGNADGIPVAVKLSFEGELLWSYLAPDVQYGELQSVWRNEDGNLVVFGWGRARREAPDATTWQILACLDPQSGEALWQESHPDTETHMRIRASATATPTGYAIVNFILDEHAFCCVTLDKQGRLTAAWTEPAPGFISYRGILPFSWQGGLWVQAVADSEVRMDAHYQRLTPPTDEP